MLCSFVFLFCFFKQKTAYEVRISDWSSDVCSSDLPARRLRQVGERRCMSNEMVLLAFSSGRTILRRGMGPSMGNRTDASPRSQAWRARSEENTPELQTLMRISYPVSCLKKKTTSNADYIQ